MSVAIDVQHVRDDDPLTFDVTLREGASVSRHRVTLARRDFIRLGGDATAQELIDAVLRFLLDREPKESILDRFDVSVVSRYFPDFETRLADYL
jgi:hypothetical protein